MKVNYIDPSAAILEFKRLTGLRGNEGFGKQDMLVFINDALDRILPPDQQQESIVLLPVRDYKCELPDNFKSVIQAAYRLECDNKVNPRICISELSQNILGSDCDLKINLDCPKCKEFECNCKTSVVTVNADRLFEMNNPHLLYQHTKHFYGYGTMTPGLGAQSQYHPEFRLMRRTSSSFFNVPYHISECVNLNMDCNIEYTIDPPNMIVNFREGEVLLAYMGDRVNEEGYRLLPNDPTVIRAVSYCLAERWFYQQYIETLDKAREGAWLNHVKLSEQWIARAKSRLRAPEFDDMFDFVTGFIYRVVPKYDYWEDLGRRRKDSFMYPGETYNLRGYRG